MTALPRLRAFGQRAIAFGQRPLPNWVLSFAAAVAGVLSGFPVWGIFFNIHFTDRVHAIVIGCFVTMVAAVRPFRESAVLFWRNPRGKTLLVSSLLSTAWCVASNRMSYPSITTPSSPVTDGALAGEYSSPARGGMILTLDPSGTGSLRYPEHPGGMPLRWSIRSLTETDKSEADRWRLRPIEQVIDFTPFVYPSQDGFGPETRVPQRSLPIFSCGDIDARPCFMLENLQLYRPFVRTEWPWYWQPWLFVAHHTSAPPVTVDPEYRPEHYCDDAHCS